MGPGNPGDFDDSERTPPPLVLVPGRTVEEANRQLETLQRQLDEEERIAKLEAEVKLWKLRHSALVMWIRQNLRESPKEG